MHVRIGLFAAVFLGGCTGTVGSDGEATGGGAERLAPCIDTADPDQCTFEEDTGGCFVTGIGHFGDEDDHPGAGRAKNDSFGGNAMGMKDGSVRGQWQNTTHMGDLFHGSVDWLRCWKDDGEGPEVPKAIPNNAEWGGTGKWNHQPGYTFAIHAQDRAEGGSHRDYYEISIWDPDGIPVYEDGDIIDGGNFQIHPPNAGHPYETEYMPAPTP